MTSPGEKVWLGVVGITFAAFMAVLDVQIVNTSLNDIAGSLGASPPESLLANDRLPNSRGCFHSIDGFFVQRFGLRNTAVGVIALFAGFSLACAQAWNFPSMIAFRAFQGCLEEQWSPRPDRDYVITAKRETLNRYVAVRHCRHICTNP